MPGVISNHPYSRYWTHSLDRICSISSGLKFQLGLLIWPYRVGMSPFYSQLCTLDTYICSWKNTHARIKINKTAQSLLAVTSCCWAAALWWKCTLILTLKSLTSPIDHSYLSYTAFAKCWWINTLPATVSSMLKTFPSKNLINLLFAILFSAIILLP